MLGRRSQTPAEPVPLEEAVKAGGKGRPTPKRREAEQQRKEQTRTFGNPKENRRQARERARTERARARHALVSGDERGLPPRDSGPVRRHVRDMVDGRRTVAEFFLPFALVVLVLNFVQVPALLVVSVYGWMVLLITIIIDSLLLRRRIRREVAERFPEESSKGAVGYGIQRSLQMRRLRLPPPRVKPGGRPV